MNRRFKAALVPMFAVVALAVAQLASAADVTGTWIMAVETGAGSGTPTFILVQKGNVITGSYKGQLGEAPVTGTLTGDDVVLEYTVDVQGQSLAVKYTGTVTGKSMSGKVSLGALGNGTFKGTLQ